jgi:hypothetical protein
MICGIIMDMKERRFFLDIRRNKWHCMAFYDFPGGPLPRGVSTEGARSLNRDDEIRQQFREGESLEMTQACFDASYGRSMPSGQCE